MDAVLRVDVGVGVGVEHLADAVFVVQDAAELRVAVAERGPLLGGELGGFDELAGAKVGVHDGQGDQVWGVGRGQQRGGWAALGQGIGKGRRAAVQGGAGGGAGQGEPAAAELVA